MIKRVLTAAMAVGMLAGCPDDTTAGGGGGVENQRTGVDSTVDVGDQLWANLSRDLVGNQRDYAQAYTRATWVHAQLSAGDWERANDDLNALQGNVEAVMEADDVPQQAKNWINQLTPTIETLQTQINDRDRAALNTASELVSSFNNTTNALVAAGWLGERGGGAGQ